MEMVNIFGRAAILTILILTAWFLLSSALEGDRNARLTSQIDAVMTQENAVNAYLDYLKTTNDTQRYCSVLSEHIQLQNEKLFPLVGLLDQARENSLQNQYDLVRQRFISANAQLFFSLKTYQTTCPDAQLMRQPILYFYPDGPCTDCLIQAQILNEIRDSCTQNVQIFAFPVEASSEVSALLVKDYSIQKTPSLVIQEKVYEGVQNKSKLNTLLSC
jgi:hypothetical protein